MPVACRQTVVGVACPARTGRCSALMDDFQLCGQTCVSGDSQDVASAGFSLLHAEPPRRRATGLQSYNAKLQSGGCIPSNGQDQAGELLFRRWTLHPWSSCSRSFREGESLSISGHSQQNVVRSKRCTRTDLSSIATSSLFFRKLAVWH